MHLTPALRLDNKLNIIVEQIHRFIQLVVGNVNCNRMPNQSQPNMRINVFSKQTKQ